MTISGNQNGQLFNTEEHMIEKSTLNNVLKIQKEHN